MIKCSKCREPFDVEVESNGGDGILQISSEHVFYTCCPTCKDEFNSYRVRWDNLIIEVWVETHKLTPDKNQPVFEWDGAKVIRVNMHGGDDE